MDIPKTLGYPVIPLPGCRADRREKSGPAFFGGAALFIRKIFPLFDKLLRFLCAVGIFIRL
ncbi:hypothetical protein HM1_0302 [Heliomicrobium modesticaldum Ice1]|uniref:Uncharacterized protein n=1 Tax=Heliobacterium modesticaldum (strain ATCC 51547 / Ice1) TaxID=498761 RepID=B0TEK2_HELMI|nr:hypothetical protein HM1_0302 [Heliomicrobium modesticaldum Ice1]